MSTDGLHAIKPSTAELVVRMPIKALLKCLEGNEFGECCYHLALIGMSVAGAASFIHLGRPFETFGLDLGEPDNETAEAPPWNQPSPTT